MMLDPVLAEALARGSQVVTGNQRAARTLRRGFDAAMREAGQSHWEPAAISTLDQWLAGLWHRRLLEGEDDRILLNRSQEKALWTSVIRADEPSLPAASLAALAAEAWSRLLLHNGRTGLREAGISADTRAFQRWVQGFERRLGRERWLTVAQLPSELQAAVEEGSLAVPDAGLMVVGFDVITPAVEGLFESLRLAGFAVVSHQAVSPNVHRYLAAYEDETGEIRAAARFARECLRGPGLKPDASGGSMSGLKPGPTPSAGTGAPKAGTGAEDRLRQEPGARIAIVVPNLAERKLAIGRGFREVFSPAGEDAPFEFSLGQAMADTALAATALDLLRWTQHSLPIETIGALLLSPWFGASLGDTTVLAEFDAFELRRLPLLRPELTLVQMIAVLERSKWRSRLGDVLARLRAMQEIAAGRAQTSHEGWAEAFRDVLEAARLERRANSDSIGFQTLRSWDSALDELATLDFDGVAVTAGSALESLERIAAETIFAPESQDAPIQIMGPLEAAGSTFDVLWVMGAGEVTWPPQAATTPLLPWRLQQQLAMPGADAARERELAERLTDRLAGSAGTGVFSHAATLADGAQQASPLLAALGLTDGPINERNTGILHYVQDDGSLRGDGHSVRDDKRLRRGEALAYELVPDAGGAGGLSVPGVCDLQAGRDRA